MKFRVQALAPTPIPTPMVTYYRVSAGRNVGIAVVFGDWPERVLTHRGWTNSRYVCERQATAEEQEWLAGCNRFQAMRYKTLEGLLEDEARIIDAPQLARIARALAIPMSSSIPQKPLADLASHENLYSI